MGPREAAPLGELMKIAMMSALSLLLMEFVRVPLLPTAPFLTYDFSEVPALILAFTLGPAAGLAVVVIKNLLFLLLNLAPWELIGIPVNTLAGIALVGIASSVGNLRRQPHLENTQVWRGLLWGSGAMVLLMLPLNVLVYWLMSKFFSAMVPFDLGAYLVAMILPFNIIKSLTTSLVVGLLWRRLAWNLRGQAPLAAGAAGG